MKREQAHTTPEQLITDFVRIEARHYLYLAITFASIISIFLIKDNMPLTLLFASESGIGLIAMNLLGSSKRNVKKIEKVDKLLDECRKLTIPSLPVH